MNPYEPPEGDIEPPKEPKEPKENFTMFSVCMGVTGIALFKAATGGRLEAVFMGIIAAVLWGVWIKRRD